MGYDERWFAARGINPLHAAEILAHVIDEKRVWKRIFESDDPRVVLQAMMFLVSMRDGKPAQQINVTSLGVTISTDEIEKARAIVREIVRGDVHVPSVHGEEIANAPAPLMLREGEGGEKGG